MSLKQVVASQESPVSLEELKAHIGQLQSTGNEDDILQLKLDAATVFLCNELGRPIITSTWDLCIREWPNRWMYLPCNTQSITSVKYTDSDGAEHTLDAATYKLVNSYDGVNGGAYDAGAARLYLAYGKSWPTNSLDVGEPITIRLVAGWKDASSVPVPVKQAALMLASHWYRNRDAVIVGRGEVSAETAIGVQRLTSVYEDRRW